MTDAEAPSPRISRYVAIALVSCAVLLFEVLITRVLSVVLWYHFAFLSISLAMLGLGAPGVWFSIRPPGKDALRRALVVSGLTAPAAIALIVRYGASFRDSIGFWIACILVPLLALGSAVCILLIEARGRAVATMYAADLAGATLGAAAAVPLLRGIPTPSVLAALGVLPLIAAMVIDRRAIKIALPLVIALGALIAWGKPFRLRYTKSYDEVVEPLYEKWTPTGRVTVLPYLFFEKDPRIAFGWGMGANFKPFPLRQMWLEQDGSAGTPITRLDRPPAALPHLFFDVTSVPYQLRKPDTVCIVGAGGGRDILTAVAAGSRVVHAVELNPYIVDAATNAFGSFSGDVYRLPGVTAVVSEGRSFLARTPFRYDIVQISLIDSWAATAAGAFALSENGLYTVDALRIYLQRLSLDGVVSISRWFAGRMQMESPRLALMAKEALRQHGVADPLKHIVVVQAGQVANLMMFAQPVSDAQLAQIDAVAEKRGFLRLFPRTGKMENATLIAVALEVGEQPFAEKGFDISPVTDDRPFFFQSIPVLKKIDPKIVALFSTNEQAVLILRGLFQIVAVLTLALFVLPLVLGRRIRRERGFALGSIYFAVIGVGFMLVEVAWLGRFSLYLGHPSTATPVILGTMLLFAGIGSFVAGRFATSTLRKLIWALPLVLLAIGLALPSIFSATIGSPIGTRIAIAIAIVAPAGTVMGLAFPIGMIRFGEANRSFFWAVNGATSVLASVGALILSMAFGFSRVVLMGVACYAIAALVVWIAREEVTSPTT